MFTYFNGYKSIDHLNDRAKIIYMNLCIIYELELKLTPEYAHFTFLENREKIILEYIPKKDHSSLLHKKAYKV